jgi:hypothetical protein
MCYRKLKGFKYATTKEHIFETGITGFTIDEEYFSLDTTGKLIIKCGYSWNGANCFPDLESIMRGSLVHDCGYQLIRMGLLPPNYKDTFDRIIQRECVKDGMNLWLADKVYWAVKRFGKGSCLAGTEGKELKLHFVTQGVDI